MKWTKLTMLCVALTVCCAIASFSAQKAKAATITTNAVYRVYEYDQNADPNLQLISEGSDPRTANSGMIVSQVTRPNAPDWVAPEQESATAFASVQRKLAAKSIYGTGSPNVFYFEAEAKWRENFVRTGGIADPLTFEFNIPRVTLGIGDYCYCGSHTAEYEINILVNGSTLWSSSAELMGGSSLLPRYRLTTDGTELGLQAANDPSGWNNLAYYQSDPYSDLIDLSPVVEPGEQFILEYQMVTKAHGFDYEGVAVACVGDPFNLNSYASGEISGASPVPLPSSILLLGGGLAGLALRKRRKKVS